MTHLARLFGSHRPTQDDQRQTDLASQLAEEANTARIQQLRKVYERLNRPEIISAVPDNFTTRRWEFIIDNLCSFGIHRSFHLRPEDSEYIETISVNGANRSPRTFGHGVLTGSEESNKDLVITPEEVENLGLITDLTETTMVLVNVLDGSFKPKTGTVDGDVSGTPFTISFENYEDSFAKYSLGDKYTKDLDNRKIAIYKRGIAYVVVYKQGHVLGRLSKLDISEGTENKSEEEKIIFLLETTLIF